MALFAQVYEDYLKIYKTLKKIICIDRKTMHSNRRGKYRKDWRKENRKLVLYQQPERRHRNLNMIRKWSLSISKMLELTI